MRALQSLIILFLCVASVFAQQHRVGTTGPEPPPLQGQGSWHYRAPLPHARSEVAVAEVSGKVYVIGGYADGYVDYDPTTNTWRGRAPMLRGLNHVGAVGLNGKLYCIGGFVEQNHSAVTDVSVYDPVSDKWRRLAPLAVPLGSVSVAVLDGKIHAASSNSSTTAGGPRSRASSWQRGRATRKLALSLSRRTTTVQRTETPCGFSFQMCPLN